MLFHLFIYLLIRNKQKKHKTALGFWVRNPRIINFPPS